MKYIADAFRRTYVGFNISSLMSEDFEMIETSEEETAFKSNVATWTIQSANDQNNDGLFSFSDTEVQQIIKDTTAGTVDLDMYIEIYWSQSEYLEGVLVGLPFENAMESLLADYFNNTDIQFSVDDATLKTLSAAPKWITLFPMLIGVIVIFAL